jgi:hypothetical protein
MAVPDKVAASAPDEAVTKAMVKPESATEEDKRRKTKAGSVGIVALIFQVSRIVKVPGREAKTVGRRKEIAPVGKSDRTEPMPALW